jgi:hypothetical protein
MKNEPSLLGNARFVKNESSEISDNFPRFRKNWHEICTPDPRPQIKRKLQVASQSLLAIKKQFLNTWKRS